MNNWKRNFIMTFAIILLLPAVVFAQFADNGQVNNEYARDNSMLGFWANGVVDYSRGYQDYQDPALGDASYGVATDILGSAGSSFSLGDGGSITVTMESVVVNGSGDDFVVFENGFVWEGVYMELGFVEVSSNGTDFSRMPALCRHVEQPGPWGTSDPADFYNLAGNFEGGTGFDLQDLIAAGDANVAMGLVDLDSILFVRVVDVIGDVAGGGATQDYLGRAVADPYPTPGAGCGMDITGVAGINTGVVATEESSWGSVKSLYR